MRLVWKLLSTQGFNGGAVSCRGMDSEPFDIGNDSSNTSRRNGRWSGGKQKNNGMMALGCPGVRLAPRKPPHCSLEKRWLVRSSPFFSKSRCSFHSVPHFCCSNALFWWVMTCYATVPPKNLWQVQLISALHRAPGRSSSLHRTRWICWRHICWSTCGRADMWSGAPRLRCAPVGFFGSTEEF
jgi:hypothetical protein